MQLSTFATLSALFGPDRPDWRRPCMGAEQDLADAGPSVRRHHLPSAFSSTVASIVFAISTRSLLPLKRWRASAFAQIYIFVAIAEVITSRE